MIEAETIIIESALLQEDFAPLKLLSSGIRSLQQAKTSSSSDVDAYEKETMGLAKRMMSTPQLQTALKQLKYVTARYNAVKDSNSEQAYALLKQKKKLLYAMNKWVLNNLTDKEKEMAYDTSDKLRSLDQKAVNYKTPDDIQRILNTYVKNPVTNKEILVKTALHYGPQHPAYNLAKNVLRTYHIGED